MQLSFRLYATVELVYIVYSIQLEKADSVQFPAAKKQRMYHFQLQKTKQEVFRRQLPLLQSCTCSQGYYVTS